MRAIAIDVLKVLICVTETLINETFDPEQCSRMCCIRQIFWNVWKQIFFAPVSLQSMRFLFCLLVLVAVSCGVIGAVVNEAAFDEVIDKVLDQMATEDSHMDVDGVDPYVDPVANAASTDATSVPVIDPDLAVLHSAEAIENFIKVNISVW